jgi:DNA-binding MarR family transcriptional regulator
MGRPFIAADPSSGSETDIHDFFEQIRQIQHRLDERVEGSGEEKPPASQAPASKEFVRSVLKLRAARQSIFGSALFGEPAWEVLLELYEAQLTGRTEAISSLCYASGVPTTTALRWIHYLEKEGWIERSADPKDRRRIFLDLSKKGRDALDQLFARSELARQFKSE